MKLLLNADFVPMTYEDAHFEALVIDDEGTIVFTGDLDRARARYAGAEEIDMGGKTVTPGFIDPHSHFMMTAQNFTNADLTGAASIAEVQQRLRDFIEKRGVTAEGVVQGNGYDHNAFVEGRHPSRQELDEVSREIPIIVNHASGHVGAANTRARARRRGRLLCRPRWRQVPARGRRNPVRPLGGAARDRHSRRQGH